MCQTMIDYLREKKVLILGFGREGRSTYEYLRKYLPEKQLTIADKMTIYIKDENVTVICGDSYMDTLNDFDIVIKSPGISMCGVKVEKDVEITCQTDLFLRFTDCTVVGVTGTKGKSTTASLVYEICKEAGLKTCLIGNIGVPVFEELDNTDGLTAVVEMSSHQLEFTHKSPHIAVITNIFEEHLDHYDGFFGYVNAKLNIIRYQTDDDFFVCNEDQDISQFINTSLLKSQKIEVSSRASTDFFIKLAEVNSHIKGRHTRQDVFFAATAAKLLGIEESVIEKGIENFKGIPHRMEFVGVYRGISFYNDSIATIPYAVMCAIDALEDVGTIIIGGMDRGLDYSDFEESLERSSLENIICLPETGHSIGNNMLENGCKKNILIVNDMPEAVKAAFDVTKIGKSCLFSPAAASYNFYKNFEEKGEHYKALIKQMGV